MKASELIALLSELPPDTFVFSWYDGERRVIINVDHWDESHADINLGEQ
jgi:hypothetical protein